MELLNELRVALPGVQVLFAFLLVVPFNQRFAATTPFQRDVYFVTLLLTASATVFLIAPSVHHRLLFRLQDAPQGFLPLIPAPWSRVAAQQSALRTEDQPAQ